MALTADAAARFDVSADRSYSCGRPQYPIDRQGGWVQPRTVSLWRHRYADQGLEGLQSKPLPGKQPIYTKATDRRILKLLDKSPPAGYARRTGPLLAGNLAMSTFNISGASCAITKSISLPQVMVREQRPAVYGQSCRRSRPLCGTAQKAIVLCVDEKRSIQALERAQGYPTLPDGRALAG